MFTVYKAPTDLPMRLFAVRRHDIFRGVDAELPAAAAHNVVVCVSSIAAARLVIPQGLVRTLRHPDDDPVISEVWL